MILIFIRHTQDYRSNPAMLPEGLRWAWSDRYLRKKKWWKYHTHMELSEFRYQLQQITLENLYCVRDSIVTHDIDEAINFDGVVIPTDDDDLIAPYIASQMHDIPSNTYYCWETFCHSTVYDQNIHRWSSYHPETGPNSAGFPGKLLQTLPRETAVSILMEHYMIDRMGYEKVKLEGILSVYNWHPGGLSTPFFGTFPVKHAVSTKIPEAPWAEQWVNRIVDVINNIKWKQTKLYL